VTARRLIDTCGAGLGLLAFAPIMALCALAVGVVLGRPVWFRQLRPGLHSRPFTLLKLRTMSDARGTDGTPLEDAERLGALGRFLRRWSLDELPQLWNVLCGDMSLVGPRPLLTEYLPLYSAEQGRRHNVRPGLTGWAQVNGRTALSWEERFKLDVWYVDNRGLGLDLRILALTVTKVLSRHGIHQPGQATMERFTG
jgi:sugar transferase EpsL